MDPSEAIALKSLLVKQAVAALATLHKDEPAVSMVPFAFLPDGTGIVIHVSRLALPVPHNFSLDTARGIS